MSWMYGSNDNGHNGTEMSGDGREALRLSMSRNPHTPLPCMWGGSLTALEN